MNSIEVVLGDALIVHVEPSADFEGDRCGVKRFPPRADEPNTFGFASDVFDAAREESQVVPEFLRVGACEKALALFVGEASDSLNGVGEVTLLER